MSERIRQALNDLPPGITNSQDIDQILFFEALRTTALLPTKIEQITTADATDLASAIALVNELKSKFNSLVDQMTTSGVLPK